MAVKKKIKQAIINMGVLAQNVGFKPLTEEEIGQIRTRLENNQDRPVGRSDKSPKLDNRMILNAEAETSLPFPNFKQFGPKGPRAAIDI